MPGPTSTIGASVEHLDLATVIKVSQAVSGEIVSGETDRHAYAYPEKLRDDAVTDGHRVPSPPVRAGDAV